MRKTEGEITIHFLPDGGVKIVTDKVSEAGHVRAERALGEIQRLLGGKVTKQKRSQGHHHHEHHSHDHEHDGGDHVHE